MKFVETLYQARERALEEIASPSGFFLPSFGSNLCRFRAAAVDF